MPRVSNTKKIKMVYLMLMFTTIKKEILKIITCFHIYEICIYFISAYMHKHTLHF